MPAQWIADVIGEMHIKKITKRRLASYMGVTPEYISMILNGHRCPKNAEQRFRSAIRELTENQVNDATPHVH